MGLIHLDSGVVIGFLNPDDPHHGRSRDVMAEALHLGDRIEASASVYAESLVAPFRSGGRSVEVVVDFFARFPVAILPVDHDIAAEAARLRAFHSSLRLPDALVLATAVRRRADRLVTTDGRWPSELKRSVEVGVVIL